MTNCRLFVISSGARKILLDLQVHYRREDLISRADSELDLILFNVSGRELAGSRRGNGGESDEFILGIEFDSSTGLGTGPDGNLFHLSFSLGRITENKPPPDPTEAVLQLDKIVHARRERY